jgi:type IV secretion system protein VirB8
MSRPDALKAYLADAKNWDADMTARAVRSERRAWLVAGVALLLSIGAIGAVAVLAPLKSVEPYVIRVDNATGVVDIARALKDGDVTYDEAVNKYFIGQYVRARESYSPDILPFTYRAVGLMSAPQIRKVWGEINGSGSDRNPQKVYGKLGRAEARLTAIQFLTKNVAAIRFTRIEKSGADIEVQTSHWIATLNFEYVNEPLSEDDRLLNPLGFQVTDYRVDAEVM